MGMGVARLMSNYGQGGYLRLLPRPPRQPYLPAVPGIPGGRCASAMCFLLPFLGEGILCGSCYLEFFIKETSCTNELSKRATFE
jgi:hypothetical protein